jgi:hypothetical protein
MNKNINTSTSDTIMKELGWKKYRETYVFYRKTENETYPYYISFPTDVYGMYSIYQEWYNTGQLSREQLKKYLEFRFCANTANIFVKKGQLRWALPMLAADYYWHNNNKLLHKKYVDLYEKLTGKKYL